jgi:hypothetical protein
MAKRKQTKVNETDAIFFMKLAIYLVLGSLWIKVSRGETTQIPIPVGLIAGLALTTHEHFQIDKKIEFAVLLIAMLVGFWAPFGIYVLL